MKPLIYTEPNDYETWDEDSNYILVSKKHFNEMLNEVYEAGVKDGIAKANMPYMIANDFSEKLATMNNPT